MTLTAGSSTLQQKTNRGPASVPSARNRPACNTVSTKTRVRRPNEQTTTCTARVKTPAAAGAAAAAAAALNTAARWNQHHH